MSEEMKIDFFISSLSGGGAEKVLTVLAKEFAKSGGRVGVVSLEKRPQFYHVDSSVRLTKFDNNSKCGVSALFADFFDLLKYVKHSKADLNISFLSRCNLLLLIISIFAGCKVVVCDRNNPLKEHSRRVFWLSCQLYRRATVIVVQTEKIRSFYPAYLRSKIVVIENPIDEKALTNQVKGKEVIQQNVIITMGRLEPQKDFFTLIDAFSKIADKYPDWKVWIFGKGDMADEIQHCIDVRGLNDRVLLRGRTDTPYLEMRRSKIFVLSSHYEGFPNVLCEGMFAGLACVSSDCVSGPSELIESGKNGYLFPIGDANQLAVELDRLCASEQLRREFGNKGKQTVKRLSVASIFEKWSALAQHNK